jgi:hypothetical protein
MAEEKPGKPESTEIQNPFTPPDAPKDAESVPGELSDEEAAGVAGGAMVAELRTSRRIVEMTGKLAAQMGPTIQRQGPET